VSWRLLRAFDRRQRYCVLRLHRCVRLPHALMRGCQKVPNRGCRGDDGGDGQPACRLAAASGGPEGGDDGGGLRGGTQAPHRASQEVHSAPSRQTTLHMSNYCLHARTHSICRSCGPALHAWFCAQDARHRLVDRFAQLLYVEAEACCLCC
jgi:hypothetical protein